MISGIRGRVARFGASSVVIDTGGVEYELYVPLDVFASLQKTEADAEVHLYVHHQFSQDEQRLYGFSDEGRRALFVAIRGLKGIGPALALSLLSHLDGPALLELCQQGDVKGLSRIPRIGKTTAEMIVFEIGRKLEKWRKIVFPVDATSGSAATADDAGLGAQEELALQALLQLGYKEKEALVALGGVPDRETRDAGELIRETLQRL